MANRDFQLQSIHDRVVSTVRNYLNQKDYDIYENPNGYTNARIGDHYPDIIMTAKGTFTADFIIEVETGDSITLAEATYQWKKYAAINASFYILVPFSYKNIANDLCRQVGIAARLGTYQQDAFGNISNIIFE